MPGDPSLFLYWINLLLTHMRRRELAMVAIFLVSILITGCTSPFGTGYSNRQTPVPSTPLPTTTAPDPEVSLREYFYAFNFVDDDALLRLLAKNVIDTTGRTAIHTTASAFSARNYISFTDYTMLSKTVAGNSATLTVEIGENNQGIRQTSTRSIPFVFEDGIWKLNEFVTPD